MRVMLLNPYGMDIMFMAAAYLAPNLRKMGHCVKVLDCAFENIRPLSNKFSQILNDYAPDAIGISWWSFYNQAVNQAIAAIRNILPKVIIVVGGPHACVQGKRVFQDNDKIDFAIRGEGEFSFPLFLERFDKGLNDFSAISGLVWKRAGEFVENPVSWIKDLDEVGIPDYEQMKLSAHWKVRYGYGANKGRPSAPVYISRGCPYTCQFCSTPLCMGPKVRMHSVKYVLKLFSHLYERYKVCHFNIIDDNFTFNREYVLEFCQGVAKWAKPDVSFYAPQGFRLEHLGREELVAMKNVGWDSLVVAPESGSLKTLKRMHKDINLKMVIEKIKLIREIGLNVTGFFIIGYPGETMEDIKMTFDFADKCDFDAVFFNKFQPLPGTPVFKELVANGKISPDYTPTNYHGVEEYAPEGIRPDKLHWIHNYATYRYHLKSLRRIRYVLKNIGIFRILKVIFKDHQIVKSINNILASKIENMCRAFKRLNKVKRKNG